MAKQKPNIWGYARSSTDEQVDGPQTQRDRIVERAKQLEEKGEGVFRDVLLEHESAESVPYNKRVQFMKLLDLLKDGDILIVCWLNRIERSALRMVAACQMLAQRGIRIIELISPSGGEMDLGTTEGRNMLLLRAIFVNMDSQQRADATKAGMNRARRLGRKLSGWVPYGKHEVKREETEYIWRDGRQVPTTMMRTYVEWDIVECQQLAELVMRARAGESIYSIAQDWFHRRLKRSCGTVWSPKAYNTPKGQVVGMKLYRAYKWAEKEIAATGCIGPIEMPKLEKKERALPRY